MTTGKEKDGYPEKKKIFVIVEGGAGGGRSSFTKVKVNTELSGINFSGASVRFSINFSVEQYQLFFPRRFCLFMPVDVFFSFSGCSSEVDAVAAWPTLTLTAVQLHRLFLHSAVGPSRHSHTLRVNVASTLQSTFCCRLVL